MSDSNTLREALELVRNIAIALGAMACIPAAGVLLVLILGGIDKLNRS